MAKASPWLRSGGLHGTLQWEWKRQPGAALAAVEPVSAATLGASTVRVGSSGGSPLQVAPLISGCCQAPPALQGGGVIDWPLHAQPCPTTPHSPEQWEVVPGSRVGQSGGRWGRRVRVESDLGPIPARRQWCPVVGAGGGWGERRTRHPGSITCPLGAVWPSG